MKLATGQNICLRRAVRGSFTLWDLLALLVVVALWGTWFAFNHLGERGRIHRCAGNLEELGAAMQSFANDHDDSLPAAGIDLENTKLSWDMDLFPYLKHGLAKSNSPDATLRNFPAISQAFYCPSDPIGRTQPRSYAMSERDMAMGWPPNPQDQTGVGLWWDTNTVRSLLGNDIANDAELPELKRSILSDPANTLLLTELIARGNILESLSNVRVHSVKDQSAFLNGDSSGFHLSKFNYLMADGHVELLTASQTGGTGRTPAGIWTIKAGD